MTLARGPRRRNPTRNRPLAEGELPTFVQLECFSESSLRQWQAAARNLNELQTALFFGLELERQRHSEALIDAVRGSLTCGEPFESWARIIDYRYCCSPLSVAGSVRRDGGRFNMGAALGPVWSPCSDNFHFRIRCGISLASSVCVLNPGSCDQRRLYNDRFCIRTGARSLCSSTCPRIHRSSGELLSPLGRTQSSIRRSGRKAAPALPCFLRTGRGPVHLSR